MSKVAWVFPGQGCQTPGMGKDFYENSEDAKALYEKASELLQLDMKELCFEENDKLDLTEYTQAALVTTCIAMAGELEKRGLKPDMTAGLSLGEYCAIYAAGGMSAEDAIKTVRVRGILMQDTVPAGEGGMAAVLGMDAEPMEKVLAGVPDVWIANYNCPGQIVITGKADAVLAAAGPLKAAGAKRVLPLKVSGPFHSPLLESAGARMEAELEKAAFSPLQIPYVTNVTAEPVSEINETKGLLKQQIYSSVRWEQSVRRMIADGIDTFVEIGPGRTLNGFMRKINRAVKVYNVSSYADVDTVVNALKN
ncbi:MAG: ACP S-malonyltransferase [Lachnospiraceae bacterium]|nr:ACP S-malonyltransferase [Lachnospiraceae bacterium]